MAEFNYKSLFEDVKSFLTNECDYAKFTAVEKLSVLLSATAVVLVLMIIGACVLFNLAQALVSWLADQLGSLWPAYLIVSAILLLGMLLVYALRKSLIIDPVTRFITKLLIKPDDTTK